VFRSAVESGGLTLTVDCPPLPDLVYVDRDMWEKVVLNLLSNAFKHTFHGGICVTQRWRGDHVELAVADSGVGIPEAELPRVASSIKTVSPTTPVFLLTGWGKRTPAGEALPNIDHILSKPPRMADIRMALEGVCAQLQY
jgi:light-regulated signal transduction histidine kinase (bacteriophytochrome)